MVDRDPDEVLTMADAAREFHVAPNLISWWRQRGRIAGQVRARKGKNMTWVFRRGDLVPLVEEYRAKRAKPEVVSQAICRKGLEVDPAASLDPITVVAATRELLAPHDRVELARRRAKLAQRLAA